MSAPGATAEAPLPWLFFLVAIVIAVAVGILIAYLGLTGHLGAGIPGSKSPSGGAVFTPLLGGAISIHNRIRGRL
jgi:hypothetical protein